MAQEHRDAYGVAGTLVAVAIFISDATDSLDKVGAMTHTNTSAILVGIRLEVDAHSTWTLRCTSKMHVTLVSGIEPLT